jgi:hypothetical protein
LYALAIPRPKITPILADTRSIASDESDFTVREDGERQVITEVTRTEFLDGQNGVGTIDSYHTIEQYNLDGIPHRQTVHHQSFVEYPPVLEPDYEQDDRSIESYHTNDHLRVYEPGLESLNRRRL